MFNRKQMLNKECTHHDYMAQFLTDGAIDYVVRHIGAGRIVGSTDQYLNDIPLRNWDLLDMRRFVNRELWKDCELVAHDEQTQLGRPFIFSISNNVSLAKTAARIYRDANRPEVQQ